MRKAESKVILGKRARDREKSTFPSLTELRETNIAVNLAFAVAINACCCNQNVPWIKRLPKAHWVGTRFWQREDHWFFKHLASCASRKALPHSSSFFISTLKLLAESTMEKSLEFWNILKTPGGRTANKLLSPNYSISFKVPFFTKGQNNWNTTKHTENCSLLLRL